MGFEPMMRVLQTLALPLGDVAASLIKTWLAAMAHSEPFQPAVCCASAVITLEMYTVKVYQSGRWDSNPRPSPWQGDVLPLYYAREFRPIL